MILVDANLLVYAHVEDMPQHKPAAMWLDERLSQRSRVGLPWESLLAFVRLVTNPRLFPDPEGMADAWAQVEDWLRAPQAWVPAPTDRHADVLASLMPLVSHSSLAPDAHLAALAIEYGLVLMSADGDFARFQAQGLRWQNPLPAG